MDPIFKLSELADSFMSTSASIWQESPLLKKPPGVRKPSNLRPNRAIQAAKLRAGACSEAFTTDPSIVNRQAAQTANAVVRSLAAKAAAGQSSASLSFTKALKKHNKKPGEYHRLSVAASNAWNGCVAESQPIPKFIVDNVIISGNRCGGGGLVHVLQEA